MKRDHRHGWRRTTKPPRDRTRRFDGLRARHLRREGLTALWLWARRTGLAPLVPVFCDTGWESQITYAYLDDLENRIGPLRRVASAENFEQRTLRSGTFPSRARKWCSPELKVEPTAAELTVIRDQFNDDVTVLVGYRRDESGQQHTWLTTGDSRSHLFGGER